MALYGDLHDSSPSPGAAKFIILTSFVSSWEFQQSDILRGPKRDPALPGRCQLRATVATPVSYWEVPRVGVLRGPKRDLAIHG